MNQTHLRAAAVAILLGVVGATFIGKLPPAIPVLAREYGLSVAAIGWLLSMFNFLGVFCGVMLGLTAARVGAYRFCIGGLLLLVAGSCMPMFVPGVTTLFSGRFLEGLGFMMVVIGAPGLITLATAPRDRALAFGFWGAYMPTGTSIAMLATPYLIAAGGWHGLWAACAVLAALMAALLFAGRADYRNPPGPAPDWASISVPLKRAGPWWIALAFACYTFQFNAIMNWLPTFLTGERAASLNLASNLTAAMVGINIFGNLAGGWLMKRGLSRGACVSLGGLLMGSFAIGTFATSLPDGLRFACCLAFSMGGGVIPGSVMSATTLHARNAAQIATVQGMIIQGSNLGQFIAAPFVAYVVGEEKHWDNILYLLVGAATIAFIGGRMVARIERRMQGTAAAPQPA
ncbi:MAG TPA: MFS transporter [Burkholderiales bacterium]|jgi:MFS family permease